MTHYLAIDQGTHASRAVLFDDAGRALASCAQAIELENKGEGRVEQSPEAVLRSVERVTQELLGDTGHGSGRPIAACGIATQRSTLLACDAAGTPLGPALSWQDTRAAAALAGLAAHHDEIQRLSGLPVSAHYGATKARWLLDHLEHAATPTRIAPLASYLLLHLVENRPFLVDHANAQRTQLMDIATLDWSPTLAAWFDVPLDCLPACKPIRHDYGCLADSGIPVTAVSGDQGAALFGNGPLDVDTAHINLGSGAFILRQVTQPAPLDRLLTGIAYSDTSGAAYLREATVNGAGSALSWAVAQLGVQDVFDHLPVWLDTVTDLPLFLNAVGGIGSPWWETRLRPAWHDAAGHGNAERLVAVIESIVFLLTDNLKIMASEAPLRTLRLSGGLSRLDGLCRKLADLTGLKVERVEHPEATARGIAWLCAGRPAHWTVHASQHFAPRDDAALQARYRRFNELLLSLRTDPGNLPPR